MTITKAKFKAWLAKQPEGREFDYSDNHHCLIASFLREGLGLKRATAGGFTWHTSMEVRDRKIPDWLRLPLRDVLTMRFTVAQARAVLFPK